MFKHIITLTCAIICTVAIYFFLKHILRDVPTTKVTAGTLENVIVSRDHVFSDDNTSELVLSDGTHVTVKGTVNVWRRGSEVVHLVPKTEKENNSDKADNKWCIGEECFWQK